MTNTSNPGTPRRSFPDLIDLRRDGAQVNLLNLPPRTDNLPEQLLASIRSGTGSRSRFVFGVDGAGRSAVPPQTGTY